MNKAEGIKYLEVSKYIKSPKVLDFTEQALHLAKEEFFELPASMSGKYHPEYSLGSGGLVRHTKAAVILASELFPIYEFTELERDYITSALYLHDMEKPDKSHPIMVKRILSPLKKTTEFKKIIPLIESHMGQWNLLGELPLPIDDSQKFVHLCDYLASRKSILVHM